ncbi:CheR family methyltransferase [Crocosphaera sp. XPORK-15E]|uniref:CheR family methyltransferase n=1 Tax=Crocosphaera sp. XPORK-15E TaxID=3110247 RepID=UPI002B217273|nr:CheR family methyltransferase [Crocosphaera sp. XPORK-15E]MEA5535718.1 CheR family methyltransferase [Crocosphaera sp. XPORK-15E]
MNQHYQMIEALLAQRMGWEVSKIGSRQLTKAIAARQKACGFIDLRSYLERLQANAKEFQELIEQLVVRESWFFRHREAFVLLRHHITNQWLPNHPQETLRVLSIPCSTGEEPYSIAMTLLNSPLAPQQLQIEGMDISQIALSYGKQGIYGKNSFRNHDWVEHQQFFEINEESYHISESIRRQVKFSSRNLLAPWLPGDPPYHVIFCRHLLIYLDELARDRVIKTLDRLLCDQGLLFVGAVETTLIKSPTFRFMSHPSAFAYQKILTPSSPTPPIVFGPVSPVTKSKKPQTSQRVPLSSHKVSEPKLSFLEMARQLANQGKLKEAAQSCHDYLKRSPIDASAYLLLGEIYQAEGNNEQAQRYLQKALYLKPNYREALAHLVLLRESQGDTQGAAVLKNRMQRLDNL